MMRVVPLVVTEEALRLLRFTYADFATPQVRVEGVWNRRRSVGILGTHDFQQVRAQGAYLRLVSIVEAYTDTVSAMLFDERTSGADKFFFLLADAVYGPSTNTWANRKECFNKYHGISLGGSGAWSNVDAAIEVRNAIAHGLGRLTLRQRSGKARSKIASSGVLLRDDEVVIDDQSLRRCLSACVKFISDIDHLLVRLR